MFVVEMPVDTTTLDKMSADEMPIDNITLVK